MECRDFTLQLDDLLDGGLDASNARRFRSTWRAARTAAASMSRRCGVAGRAQTFPARAAPGFIDQALSRATRIAEARPGGAPSSAWRSRRVWLLGVALGVFFATQPTVQTWR